MEVTLPFLSDKNKFIGANVTMTSKKTQSRSAVIRNLSRKRNFRYALIWQGVAIGAITGIVISFFRYLLIFADNRRDELVAYAKTGLLHAVIAACVMFCLVVLIAFLLAREPEATGSGIPQVEAELLGRKDMHWFRVLVSKILGCALSIGGGLALGREGPSIQIGAMVGKGFARSNRRVLTEERYLMSCGAGAGLSAAFGAPLAGTIFCLEELYHNFSSEVLLSTMAAATTSDFVTAHILGLQPVFGFEIEHSLPLKYYWFAMILGVILGFFGTLYNRTIAKMQDIFDAVGRFGNGIAQRLLSGRYINTKRGRITHKTDVATFSKLMVGMTVAYVCFFLYPITLGSGNNLVGEIAQGSFALKALVILLIVKFVFSTMSFGTTAPGGIFLPLLVIGAVTGGVYSRALEAIVGINSQYIEAFVVLAMAGYFAAIVHAPVTGVVLITEMTSDFRTLLPMVMVSLIAYVISEAMGTEPIYTQLMNRGKSAQYKLSGQRKTIVDDIIHPGSDMDGRMVMEMGLPIGTLIVSVIREEEEFIPDGHTILRGGDVLEILAREADLAEVERLIETRCKTVQG